MTIEYSKGQIGRETELAIKLWLLDKGMSVFDLGQVPIEHGQGFQVDIEPNTHVPAPDFLVYNPDNKHWFAADSKHVSRFLWSPPRQQWSCGVPIPTAMNYLHICDALDLDLYLLFFVPGDPDPDHDLQSPTGLFSLAFHTHGDHPDDTNTHPPSAYLHRYFYDKPKMEKLATLKEMKPYMRKGKTMFVRETAKEQSRQAQ